MPGHLEKRNNKSWTIIVEAGRDPGSGKRKRIKRAFCGTKREAEKELALLLAEVEKGTYVEPANMTVAEYLRWWLDAYGAVKLKPRTLDSYRMICEKHLIPALGAIRLDKLHQMHLQQYQARALENGRADGRGGLSPRTVQYHHRVLGKSLAYAVQNRILAHNIARDVQAPVPEKKPMQALSPEEVKQLLAAATGHRDYQLIYTAVNTGMRRGEILGMRWQDLNLTHKIVQVQQTLQHRRGHGFLFGPPKTKTGARPVPLPVSVVTILKEIKKKQAANRLQHGINYLEHDLVFCEEDGSPIHPDNMSHRFENLAASAGFPNLRFHDLRHTWATLALAAGIHPKIVQSILGHSTIAITLDIYSHTLPGMYNEAADKIEDLLLGSKIKDSFMPGEI